MKIYFSTVAIFRFKNYAKEAIAEKLSFSRTFARTFSLGENGEVAKTTVK